jgi:hypothetical protein
MPNFKEQFETPKSKLPWVYMGGTAMSCGKHSSLPKRHRWGPWRKYITRGGYAARERTCQVCSLVSDAIYSAKPVKMS